MEAVEEIDEEVVEETVLAEAAELDEETEVEVDEGPEQPEEPAEESEHARGRYSAEKRSNQDDDVITTTSFSYGYTTDADEGEDRRD